jgi:two-component system CheB/CheR fusion protein
LARSRLFTARHPKWRVFQRLLLGGERHATVSRPDSASPAAAPGYGESAHGETQAAVSRAQRALETLPAAVMVIDMADTVLTWNAAAEQLFDIPSANALTRKFRDLDVSYRVEGLRARIEDVKSRHASTRMENAAFTRRDGAPVHADIAISPLIEGQRLLGILVFAVEATEQARLREQMMRVAEQHATAIEELQSTNEELETTNEELQSTNEELETTNEELQSTNEELETTVEELQAANAELAALNTELEARTAELNRLDSEHNGVINSFDAAIVVLDRSLLVKTWNQAAERLWLLKGEHVLNRDFFSLPTPTIARLSREPFERIYHGASEQELSDLPYTRPGGQTGRASLRLTPLKDGSGSIIGIVAVLSPVDGTPG